MIGKPFIPAWDQLRPFIAELWLIAGIVGVLITPFFARRSNKAAGSVALVSLALALASLIIVGATAQNAGPVFGGMLVSDPFAVLWKTILLLFTMGIILMWTGTTSAAMHEGDGPEFFTLLLGATLGMSLMSSTSNLLMLVMSVEMASLPSYVLAGFRKTDRVGSEASLKYVLFGAAASSIMVYGLSMLYGLYGTLQIGVLATQIGAHGGGVPLILAIAGLLVGLGFKISAVPLHFWCPDVFEGAGIDVSAFLSVASKGAGLTLLLRVLMTLAGGLSYQGETLRIIAVIVGVTGAVTATVGNTAAFVQTNIKRLLAYSSIAHAGYMLCALSLLVRPGSAGADWVGGRGVAQAILLYLSVYMFMNLGAFTVAGLIHRATGSEKIADYAGMGRRNPVLALALAACLFSLVGLPPFAGFMAKLQVMVTLGSSGGWWWALVAVIGVNTIVSLYYYARVIKVMYLNDSDQPEVVANPIGSAVAVACAVMLFLMLVGIGPVMKLAERYGRLDLSVSPAPPAQVVVSAR